MGDRIAITNLAGAFVQENGIIRIADGRYIGRLEDIEYSDIVYFEGINPVKKKLINVDKLEHLLNCMANQKYIHEQSKETQEEWQGIIDKAWNEGMAQLYPPKAIESNESAQA